MASIPKFANNFTTTLTQNASVSSDKLYLDVVDGLPDISGGNFFRLTIKRESDGAREIVKVNAVDTISRYVSVERGDENSTPLAFTVGDEVQLRLTAEPLNDIFVEVDRLTTAETNLLAASQTAIDSADAAEVSATNALVSEQAAASSEVNALASEQAAALSESNAANSATAANNSRIAAEAAQSATESVYDQFDDRYLGNKAAAPTLDNDGNTLLTGALYFNTTDSEMYVYTGSDWTTVSNTTTAALAEQYKDEAAASAATAGISETNSATSATLAGQHKDAAAASATSAAASRSDALAYRDSAAVSATQASTSADNAANSEGIARDYANIIRLQYKPAIQPTLSSDFVHNEHKLLDQYGLEPKTLPQTWNVTRSTTKTRVNALGLIETVPIDTAAIDYDPVTGECKGLLVEEQRTNLLVDSAIIGNLGALSTVSGGTLTFRESSARPSVVLGDTCAFFTTDDQSIWHGFRLNYADWVEGQRYTFSGIYRLPDNISSMSIRIFNFGSVGATFNFDEGTYTTIGAGDPTAKMTRLGERLYYVSVSVTNVGQQGQPHVFMTQSSGAQTFTGDGVSTLEIHYQQLEAASIASSYIPTAASQVTRAADNVLRNGQEEYSDKQGTFLITAHDLDFSKGAVRLVSVDDNVFSSTQYMQMTVTQSGILDGSVLESYRPIGFNLKLSAGTAGKFAISYSQSKLTISGNGSAISADVLPGFLDGATFIRCLRQRIYGGSNNTGTLKGVYYYPRTLSEAELIELTKP